MNKQARRKYKYTLPADEIEYWVAWVLCDYFNIWPHRIFWDEMLDFYQYGRVREEDDPNIQAELEDILDINFPDDWPLEETYGDIFNQVVHLVVEREERDGLEEEPIWGDDDDEDG